MIDSTKLIKRFCTLLLLLLLTACSSSDDDQLPDNPPNDDPVVGPDCLGDIAADGTIYCVDPDTGSITATLADGTVGWSFNLADSESSPTIDTLILIDEQPWLVADSGRQIGMVRREQEDVLYGQIELESGGYIPTSTRRSYDYQRDERALPAFGIGNSAYIVTDIYELINGADRELDDSWHFLGASLSRIEPSVRKNSSDQDYATLAIRAQRLYADRHVQVLARTAGGQLLMEFDELSERLTADTLLPATSDPARALLAGKPHEAVTSFLFTALRGDGLDEQAQKLLALGEHVRATASESLVIERLGTESNAGEGPPPWTDGDTLERIDYLCMGGGKLALERTKKVTYGSGIFPTTETSELYRYSDCQVTVSDDDPLLAAGEYRSDGEFTYNDLDDIYFQNARRERTQYEWLQLELDSPQQHSSVTNAQLIRDGTFGIAGVSSGTYTTRITSHVEHDDGEVTLSIENANYVNNLVSPFGKLDESVAETPRAYYLHIVASGTVTAFETDNQAMTISTGSMVGIVRLSKHCKRRCSPEPRRLQRPNLSHSPRILQRLPERRSSRWFEDSSSESNAFTISSRNERNHPAARAFSVSNPSAVMPANPCYCISA